MRILLASASIVLATAAGYALMPTTVEACNCIRSGFELVSPRGPGPAPITASVSVSLEAGWNIPMRVVLRDDAGRLVPTTQRSAIRGTRRVLEATPRAALASATHYEVVVVEFGERHAATVVGAFHTQGIPTISTPTRDWRPHLRAFAKFFPVMFGN